MSWPSVPSLTLPHVALSKWVCTGSFPHTRPLLTCSSPPAVPASCFCICPKNIKFLRLSLKPNGFREPSWIILTLLIAPFLNSSELQAPYQVFHTTSFDNSLLYLCQREYFQSNSCYIFAFLKFCLFSHNVFFFFNRTDRKAGMRSWWHKEYPFLEGRRNQKTFQKVLGERRESGREAKGRYKWPSLGSDRMVVDQ